MKFILSLQIFLILLAPHSVYYSISRGDVLWTIITATSLFLIILNLIDDLERKYL
jgi:hypothetical protein